MVDYSKLSNEDLINLKNGNYSAISDEGLLLLKGDTSGSTQETKPKGIDLTPSGLLRNSSKALVSGFFAPLAAIKERKPLPEAYKSNYNKLTEMDKELYDTEKHPISGRFGNLTNSAIDLTGYMALPSVKTAQGANALLKGGAFLGNAAIQGGIPMSLEFLKRGENPLVGAGIGTGLGVGIQATVPPLFKATGAGISKIVNSPTFQNGASKVLEALTSVPQKFIKRALNKELAGESILGGKFNAETAYRPVEQKLRQAKNTLPDATSYGNKFYELGQKALSGMNAIKEQAGARIADALSKLENVEVQNGGLKAAINTIINSYGKGGVYNSAKTQAPGVVNFLDKELNKEGLTLMDLHRIKEDLYNMGYALDGAKQGRAAEVARGAAEQINNYLRRVSPDYEKPNDVYSLIVDTTRGLEGQTTMGSKLSEIGSANSAKSGLDARLKAIDNLLPKENKFYNEALDLIQNEAETNNIRNLVGKQYERNPRLLANRTDEQFEQALEDLQNRSNVDFMEDLNNVRAREALEAYFPGQGGGSGSSQGFGNLLRTSVLGGVPTAAAITHNPALLLGLGAVSPKFTGKGFVQNAGRLNKLAEKLNGSKASRLLEVLGIKTTPLLYGSVSMDDER